MSKDMIENEEPTTPSKAEPEKPAAAPGWVEDMLRLYSEGRSDVEVMKDLGMTREQFNRYCAETPAFKALVERGRDYSEAWWMEISRKSLFNKDFATSNWIFNMQNRHGWHARNDKTIATETLNLDKLKDELRKAMPEMARLVNITDLAGDADLSRKVVYESTTKPKH